MKKLICDFHHRPARTSPQGWALLAAGGLLALATVFLHLRLDRQSDEIALQLSQFERATPTARREPAADAEKEAALAAVQRTLQQIELPWNALFAALEAASQDDVALLALKPDGRRGEVRIFAEARTLAAMLAFHRRLEASGQLRDVTLTDHEVVTQDPLQPVRFNVIGRWEIRHAIP